LEFMREAQRLMRSPVVQFLHGQQPVPPAGPSDTDPSSKRPAPPSPPPPSNEQSAAAPSPSNEQSAAAPSLSKRRHGPLPKDDHNRELLRQLFEQNPGWTAKQLADGYEEKTKTQVSVSWVQKHKRRPR
jgi:hypothetical protein